MHSTRSLPQAFQSAHISSHVTGNTAPSSPDHVTCAPRSRDRSWLRTFSLDHSFLHYSTTQPSTPGRTPALPRSWTLPDLPPSNSRTPPTRCCSRMRPWTRPLRTSSTSLWRTCHLSQLHKCLVPECGRLLCSVPAPASAGSERLRATGP